MTEKEYKYVIETIEECLSHIPRRDYDEGVRCTELLMEYCESLREQIDDYKQYINQLVERIKNIKKICNLSASQLFGVVEEGIENEVIGILRD